MSSVATCSNTQVQASGTKPLPEITHSPPEPEISEPECEKDKANMDLDPDVEASKDTWRCPDPGCKKSNSNSAEACSQCDLPKNSAHQFKRGHDRTAGRGGHRGGQWKNRKQHSKPLPQDADPNSPVVVAFQGFSRELDAKHDKHERIVKLSRDITIESKRIIFLLHRIRNESDKPSVLLEAEKKFKDIRYPLWLKVAHELKGEDPFHFLKAYTNGLQEYIEALSFYHFICFDRLITWKEVQQDLSFPPRPKRAQCSTGVPREELQEGAKKEEVKEPNEGEEDLQKATDEVTEDKKPEKEPAVAETEEKETEPKSDPVPATAAKDLLVYVPMTDYALGLGDLTGEIMRQAINNVGAGNTRECFKLLEFLHQIFGGFMSLPPGAGPRDLPRKVNTLKASLRKVENACYTISVRGTEVPKHLLAEYLNKFSADDQFVKFEDEPYDAPMFNEF